MAKEYKLGMSRRAINRLMSSLARRGIGQSWVLSTTGRTSGERRDFVITPVTYDGDRYLVAPYGDVSWVKNVRANPRATLSRGGVSLRITAVEVDGDEAAHALAKYYAENSKYVAEFVEIPGDHTITDFHAVAEKYPVFKATT
jgi:deazaflavin-dependent oxidoreductase (nitroreductase family)